MALDLVGPQVAATAGTTLDDGAREGRGGVRRLHAARRARAAAQPGEEDILTVLNRRSTSGRLVQLAYLSRTDDRCRSASSSRTCCAACAPTGTSRRTTARANGERTFRVDRIRSVHDARTRRSSAREGLQKLSEDREPRGDGRHGGRSGARPTSPRASWRSRRRPRSWPTAAALASTWPTAPSATSRARSSSTAARRCCWRRRACASAWRAAPRSCSAGARAGRLAGLSPYPSARRAAGARIGSPPRAKGSARWRCSSGPLPSATRALRRR